MFGDITTLVLKYLAVADIRAYRLVCKAAAWCKHTKPYFNARKVKWERASIHLLYMFADSDKHWDYMSKNQHITVEFVDRYHHKINWYNFCLGHKLSVGFIRKWEDHIVAANACVAVVRAGRHIPEDLLRKWAGKYFWVNISYQELSEQFMLDYKDKLHWYNILRTHVIPDRVVSRVHAYVHWYVVYQDARAGNLYLYQKYVPQEVKLEYWARRAEWCIRKYASAAPLAFAITGIYMFALVAEKFP